MKRRFSTIGFVAFGASIVLAGVALAQSFSTNFAQRCAPDELLAPSAPPDPCGLQVAHFGLNGPAVIGSRMGSAMLDVETTGSVTPAAPRDGDSGARAGTR